MKKIILISALLVISQAAFATDYVFGPGDEFGVLTLTDHDTLFMTGGGHDLNLSGWSTGIIHDTDTLVGPYEGGIWEVTVSGHSELTINDGEFYEMVCDDYSTTNLHGGQIFGSLEVEHITTWVHIYGYGFNNDPFTGSPLTGFWADGTPFSINLIDDTIPTYDQIVFHIVPEPVSMLMLGLGGLLVRSRKRN